MRLDDDNLIPWLQRCGVLEPGLAARVEPAGRGNLNFVRRVRTARGPSWVVKQARDSVDGFPDFRVPSERIVFERRYAQAVGELAPGCAALLPEVRHFDPAARALVLEDVGDGASLETLLAAGRAPLPALRAFGALLAAVHAASAPRAEELEERFGNLEMRRLNGAQMFAAPCGAEDLDLPQALAAARREICADSRLRARVEALARHYAGERAALVHGDAKAANVLVQGGRPRLIDAEFSHVGDPAFDLGVALGHLVLCTSAPAAQAAREPAWRALLEGYRGGETAAIEARAAHYAGAVVLAHVIGPSRQAFAPAVDAPEALRRARELLE
jgi:5-methylthioribose kinase